VYVCAISQLEYTRVKMYNVSVRQRKQPLTKEGEVMNPMTTAELNQYLETIAKLIEATAKDVPEAAQIVRDSKVKA